MGKTTVVDQLNDTTALPWILNFFKNFSSDFRKCKSNRWDYLISIHDCKSSNEFIPLDKKDPIDKRLYLIGKYNERLLVYSNDKNNPWVIDDRDEDCLILHKKNYLEFEKKILCLIDLEIEKKVSIKYLEKKEIQLERKRLSYLAKLALLKTYKEENIAEFDSITCLDSQAIINQFTQLISRKINYACIKDEIKQIKKQQEKIVRELQVHFSTDTESISIYSRTSVWEKANRFAIKNKAIQFFSTLWYGVSSHANLLNWISFLLLFFSLSLYSYPIIFLVLGISLVSYLIFHIFYLAKKDSTIFPRILTDEAEQILESVKIEVFNEEKNKNEFKLIQEIVFTLAEKNINLNEFLNSISAIQKKFYPIYPALSIQQSKLYQYLIEVYPKTQFISSLTINLTSVMLYTYLLIWAIHSFLVIVGAVSLAGILFSPLIVGLLMLSVVTFFLARHLCEFRAREDFYQRTILNRINEKCEYRYKDMCGKQQVIQIEKWRKFEYLQNNICFLELEFKKFFEKNKLDSLNNKFYHLFNSYRLEKNIYTSCEQDKILGETSPFFKGFKKKLNRFFAFSGGGFYGYNLTQQIVWKSNLGIHMSVQIFTFPILLIFSPLIIINGIANLITYHLHSRQRNRFEMVRNLDSKLKVLEQINKELLYLISLLSIEFKYPSISTTNLNDNNPGTQPDLLLLNKNISFKRSFDHFSFFKKTDTSRCCSMIDFQETVMKHAKI